MRRDEGDDRALDRRALRERPFRPLVVGGDELRLVPAHDRRDRDCLRSSRSIRNIVAFGDELRLDVVELLRRCDRRCTPRCAGGRCRPRRGRARGSRRGSLNSGRIVFSISSSVTVRPAARARMVVERAGDLTDAVGRVARTGPSNRIMIDDGLQHERVVGVDPERHYWRREPRQVAANAFRTPNRHAGISRTKIFSLFFFVLYFCIFKFHLLSQDYTPPPLQVCL